MNRVDQFQFAWQVQRCEANSAAQSRQQFRGDRLRLKVVGPSVDDAMTDGRRFGILAGLQRLQNCMESRGVIRNWSLTVQYWSVDEIMRRGGTIKVRFRTRHYSQPA